MSRADLEALAAKVDGQVIGQKDGMLVFTFALEHDALRFADATGGMLIRGLARGAVDVAVLETAEVG